MSVRKTNVVKTFNSTWEYEISAGEDKPKALISYEDDFVGWASRCPKVNSAHPDMPKLLLDKIKAKRIDGELIQVDLSYTSMASSGVPGKPDAEGDPVAKYYVQLSSGEEHILTNAFAEGLDEEELKALFAISNGNEADENNVKYEDSVTSTNGLALLEKIRKGNVAYKTGALIYGERKVITDLSSLNYLKLGKIDTPPGPVTGGAGKWLYISGGADPVSTSEVAWQMDRQWQYSPDGWDPDLYTASS
jgi:hypothetical protein